MKARAVGESVPAMPSTPEIRGFDAVDGTETPITASLSRS
jgi:hypothetical protein